LAKSLSFFGFRELTVFMESKNRAITVTILSSLIYGTSFPIIKIGLRFLDPYTFVLFRLTLASITVLATAIVLGRFHPSLFRNRTIWLAGLSNAIGFILQYVGMNYTTASKTSLLVDSNVIIIAVLSWYTFKERFSPQMKTAVVIGFLGAVLLVTNGNISELTGGELFGDLTVFFAGVAWAFYMVWNKSLISNGIDLIAMIACVQPLTTLFLIPSALLLGSTSVPLIGAIGWAAIAWTGLFCSAVAYFLWAIGLKRLTVTVSAIVILLEVVWALILSFVFLGESFTVIAAVGAVLILASIALASR
jgi:drug/metabolite transporter (DMT)-like permease